jgi:hypothetical protein
MFTSGQKILWERSEQSDHLAQEVSHDEVFLDLVSLGIIPRTKQLLARNQLINLSRSR